MNLCSSILNGAVMDAGGIQEEGTTGSCQADMFSLNIVFVPCCFHQGENPELDRPLVLPGKVFLSLNGITE